MVAPGRPGRRTSSPNKADSRCAHPAVGSVGVSRARETQNGLHLISVPINQVDLMAARRAAQSAADHLGRGCVHGARIRRIALPV